MGEFPETAAAPHVLLLATQRWPTGARLGLALRAVGFRISIWCPRGHPLLVTGTTERHYPYGSFRGTFNPMEALQAAVLDAHPDLVVPCDDLATFGLQQLADHAANDPRLAPVLAVIERSLGRASDLGRLTDRTSVLDAAASGGVAVPANARVTSNSDLRAWFNANGFPAYLKADGTSGGIGVRPVQSFQEAEAARRALDAPPRTLRALKRLAIDRDPTLMGPLVRRQRPAISVQRAVAGPEANSAVFCWQGRVLAAISVRVLATRYERGPSTVVQITDNAAMNQAAEVLAHRLHLSGFYGLDFVLDEQTGTPWLIEMNSRATQIAHLALGSGHDLAAAAIAALCDLPVRPRPLITAEATIALFPQEWERDPASPLISGAYHDVPWEAPALVRAYVNRRPGWRRLLTPQFWRDRRRRPAPDGEAGSSETAPRIS